MDHERRTHEDWIGRDLFDKYGDKIGTINDIYVDDATGRPEWMTVSTGWFGTSEQFVPISGTRAHGDDLQVDWDVDVIKGAPSIDPDDAHLTPEDERRLYGHYGFDHDADDRSTIYGAGPRADDDFGDARRHEEATGDPVWERGSPRLRRRAIGDRRTVFEEEETFRQF